MGVDFYSLLNLRISAEAGLEDFIQIALWKA
jgi:hypothetical protein